MDLRYHAAMRILVLGAGFGGLELTTRLSEEFGDELDLVLIDQGEGFIFGFSKLDVMFGRLLPATVLHPYRDIVKPGVRFVQTTIRAIDPQAKRVETEAGVFEADILVVALGADLDPSATPGLTESGHEFYTVAGAFDLRAVLSRFEGGHVIVGVTSAPFKCPPAPSETALLLHDFLTRRGIRETSDISLVMPLGVPIPPSPAASQALLAALGQTVWVTRESMIDTVTAVSGSGPAYIFLLAEALAAQIDRNVVPMAQARDDGRVRGCIGSLEVLHRLVREHDAPAEGVGRSIALVNLDASLWQSFLQQDG